MYKPKKDKEQNIIINADDYGCSVSVNKAIRECFDDGIISDTSIMTTCREGLEDLYNSRNLDCLQGTAGCHLTLTLGQPVTSTARMLPFVDADGNFQEIKSRRLYSFSKAERQIIYREFMSQIEILRNRLGLFITHLDSHQHIHMRLDFLPIVVKVCKDAKIPYLRIPSRAKTLSFKSKIATCLKAKYIQMYKIGTVDFFGSPNQILVSVTPSMKTIELMCHPMFDSKKRIVDKVKGVEPDDCIILKEELNAFKDIHLINFDQQLHL